MDNSSAPVPGGRVTTPKLAEIADATWAKYRTVVDLRAKGHTYDEIARRVGYKTRQGAKDAYDKAIETWGRDSVDNLQALEGERLDQLWADTRQRLDLVDDDARFAQLAAILVQISRRRADLYGLNAPAQTQSIADVNIQIQGEIVHETREQRVERLEALLGALVDSGAYEVAALPPG